LGDLDGVFEGVVALTKSLGKSFVCGLFIVAGVIGFLKGSVMDGPNVFEGTTRLYQKHRSILKTFNQLINEIQHNKKHGHAGPDV
jgi:hypothetical protein